MPLIGRVSPVAIAMIAVSALPTSSWSAADACDEVACVESYLGWKRASGYVRAHACVAACLRCEERVLYLGECRQAMAMNCERGREAWLANRNDREAADRFLLYCRYFPRHQAEMEEARRFGPCDGIDARADARSRDVPTSDLLQLAACLEIGGNDKGALSAFDEYVIRTGAFIPEHHIDARLVGVPGEQEGYWSPVGIDQSGVLTRVLQIQEAMNASSMLQTRHLMFLSGIDRSSPLFSEAHRLLAWHYFRLEDFRRQAEELEVATGRGPYRRDPTLLLSLASAYAMTSDFRKALSSLERLAFEIHRLPLELRMQAMVMKATLYEAEFMRQHADDPKKANATLLLRAIDAWERYTTFSRDRERADVHIKKLLELNSSLEL